MCPGRHLAEDSLFATVASVLAVYDILPPSDDKPLACKMSNAIVSYVFSFLWRASSVDLEPLAIQKSSAVASSLGASM